MATIEAGVGCVARCVSVFKLSLGIAGFESLDMTVEEGEIGGPIVTEMESRVLVGVAQLNGIGLVACIVESAAIPDGVHQHRVVGMLFHDDCAVVGWHGGFGGKRGDSPP